MTNPRTIDRRTFLAASAAFGLSASLPSAARAAGPNRGGNFRIGVADSSTSDDLDPANINTRFQTYLQYQLRNYLVEVGPGGKLIPELAESWEGTNGGKTWIFKLRKGVTFHTGKSLTAQDVIFSFNYHTKPNSKSTGKPMLSSLTGIKAEGDNTVIFDLTAANVNFPAVVSNYSFAIVPDGTTNFGGEGGSALMWKYYFGPSAKIVTIDVEDRRFIEEPQIYFRRGDQGDAKFLNSIIDEFGPPDIVLDDGSHMMNDINVSFSTLFPAMGKDAVYLVEDLDGAYWEGRGGGFLRPQSFIEKSKISD